METNNTNPKEEMKEEVKEEEVKKEVKEEVKEEEVKEEEVKEEEVKEEEVKKEEVKEEEVKEEEVKEEEVKEKEVQLDVVNDSKETISVQSMVEDYIKTNTGRINIGIQSAEIITRIVESFPDILYDLDKHVVEILADNAIDIYDVPKLILMVKDLVNVNAKQLKKIKIIREEGVIFVNDILFILIDTNVIKTGDNKDAVLELLKLSVTMLSASVDLDETIKCGWMCCC